MYGAVLERVMWVRGRVGGDVHWWDGTIVRAWTEEWCSSSSSSSRGGWCARAACNPAFIHTRTARRSDLTTTASRLSASSTSSNVARCGRALSTVLLRSSRPFALLALIARPPMLAVAIPGLLGSTPSPPPLPTHLVPLPWAQATTSSLSLARLTEFRDSLTSVVATDGNGNNVRAVHSSGGAAGGVVSEGQGYGVVLSAAVLAGLPRTHTSRPSVLTLTLELYLGWRRMCERTTSNSCQDSVLCDGVHECLPSWKFDDQLDSELGTGSAPDGDEDAILGMVMLVLAAEGDSPTPSWWESLGSWTYESCRAFLTHLTVAHPTERASNGEAMLALKLGSCWGGWDCNNPSYHAPAHYTAMRDFMTAFASRWGSTSDEAAALVPQWDALIETSYRIVEDSQCSSTGLVPNWFVPAQSSLSTAGTAGCSGSGTPAGEFGSEASRTAWRLALGWLWYGDPTAARVRLPQLEPLQSDSHPLEIQ